MTTFRQSVKILIPACFSLAVLAFVLAPTVVSAIGSFLLWAFPTLTKDTLDKAAHAAVFACILVAPGIWTAISNNPWRWSAILTVFSAVIFLLAHKFLPNTSNLLDSIRHNATLMMPVSYSLMVASSLLGFSMRLSYLRREWPAFWLLFPCYLAIMGGSLYYLAAPFLKK